MSTSKYASIVRTLFDLFLYHDFMFLPCSGKPVPIRGSKPEHSNAGDGQHEADERTPARQSHVLPTLQHPAARCHEDDGHEGGRRVSIVQSLISTKRDMFVCLPLHSYARSLTVGRMIQE